MFSLNLHIRNNRPFVTVFPDYPSAWTIWYHLIGRVYSPNNKAHDPANVPHWRINKILRYELIDLNNNATISSKMAEGVAIMHGQYPIYTTSGWQYLPWKDDEYLPDDVWMIGEQKKFLGY